MSALRGKSAASKRKPPPGWSPERRCIEYQSTLSQKRLPQWSLAAPRGALVSGNAERPRPVVPAQAHVRPVNTRSHPCDPCGDGCRDERALQVSAALLNCGSSTALSIRAIAGYASGEIVSVRRGRSSIVPCAGFRLVYPAGRSARLTKDLSIAVARSRRRGLCLQLWPARHDQPVAHARIVADEVHRTGRCDLTLMRSHARGMCRKTAKRAQDRLASWNGSQSRNGRCRPRTCRTSRIARPRSTWIKMWSQAAQ